MPKNAWTVEYQQETVDVGPDGRPTQGVKIGFETGGGLHGSVFVPRALYNPDNVRAALAQAAHQMDVVQNLKGSG
jgi:hypothetical protein